MEGQSLGSYTIERELGRGGMGAVYVAVHALLGRRAAVKVLLPELSRNQELVQRFFNEARAATAIKHPSIVEIYDFGWAPDGSAYIVMEFMEGESLAARLTRLRRLPLSMAVTIARQIANALAAAHRAGIVHRDLKPDNVFLVPDIEVVGGERVKLLDFGIAKLVADGGVARTTTGAIMGTPLYMSPEQCEGARAVDHRTDLYALGCILFEMIAGRPPFQSEGVGGLIGAHLHVPPPTLRSVVPDAPADVEAIVARLLAKAPGDRHASADELATALGQAGRGASAAGERPAVVAAPVTSPGPAVAVASTVAAEREGPVLSTLSGSSRWVQGMQGPASRASEAPRRRGRWFALGGVIAIAGVATAAVLASGGGDDEAAGGAPLDAATLAVTDAAAEVIVAATDAATAAPRDAALEEADAALAEMAAAVSRRDWAALKAALDRVYDATKDGDPRRQQADVLIEQTRPLIIAVIKGEIEGDNYRGRCADAKRRAADAIKEWGEPAEPLKKLAARCSSSRGGGEGVAVDAGVAPGDGELTAVAIARVVAVHRPRFDRCMGDTKATIALILEIAPSGAVSTVRATTADPARRACLERTARSMRFPASTSGKSVRLPLALEGPPTTGPVSPPGPAPAPSGY